jgi:hypothetical protein
MSKQAYTQMMPLFCRIVKENKMSEDDVFERLLKKEKEDLNLKGDMKCLIAGVKIDRAISLGNAVHLFLPGCGFCNWIVGCVVDAISDKHLSLLNDAIGKKIAVLHFTVDENVNSIGFAVERNPKESSSGEYSTTLVISFQGRGQEPYAWVFPVPHYRSFKETDDTYWWYARLLSGLGMYLSCFPEQLRDGPPSDLQHPSHHKHKISRTIGISPKVVTHHDGPRPHYRVGHFRLLSSDRFVNKRGQVTFVRATFVNGKAKTVLGFDGEATTEDKAVNI